MDLKLALHAPDGRQDLLIGVDPAVTVGELAARIRLIEPRSDETDSEPVTLAVRSTTAEWLPLPADEPVTAGPLLSGGSIRTVLVDPLDPVDPVDHDRPARDGEAPVAAVLTVLAGPDAGREIPLPAGPAVIGRGSAAQVALNDPLVSKRHALLRIGDRVRLTDENSANGTQVDGVGVGTAQLAPHHRVRMGDSVLQVRLLRSPDPGPRAPQVAFNRSPRVEPTYAGLDEEIAAPPQRPAGQPIPFASVVLPLLLALGVFLVTRSGLAAAFLALSSVLMIGVYVEQKVFQTRQHRRAVTAFRAGLAEQQSRFARALELEGYARRFEQPAAADVRAAVVERTPLLWARRPDRAGFGRARLATATRPSRSRLRLPSQRGDDPALVAESERAVAEFGLVPDVPVPVDLPGCGAVGVCGPDGARQDAARALVLQLVGLHSPQDLAVGALVPPGAAPDWAWLRWLPHLATGDAGPLAGPTLGADPETCTRMVTAAELLVQRRTGSDQRFPLLLVVVEDGAPVERGRLVQLAEQGGRVGVHLVWVAADVTRLPAACRSYLQVTAEGAALVGDVTAADLITPARAERLDAATAESLARSLAPVVDAGTAHDRQADLPRSASLVETAGRHLVLAPAAVIDRWQETGGTAGSPAGHAGTLRALVGVSVDGPVHLDLREQGPHALVGGTTGSGKSEFLQSWLLGMALDHSPRRLTFLLVDYKGGAAFAEVVRLPHAVGLVTDLTPRLVRRALTSLRAEVRHRERLLAAAGAPDLLELERRGDPAAPPALVIVVDEFAALVQEVPEFVDGVIDVAQRGRSLGLHLILATQRPAGVIKDNLRANTNLRVALRMADADDSLDVLDSRDAALFDPAVPGRAMVRSGPGRLTPFQALYAGGRTGTLPTPPAITVSSLGFGPTVTWPEPVPADVAALADGPTDVHRVVGTIAAAADAAGIAAPRRPWLPELPAVVDLASLTGSGPDELVLGLADDPGGQRRTAVGYRPDEDGALLVIGTGGSGKSAALRSVAIAAAAAPGNWQVYGLDFGARGLTSLEPLPHVGSVVAADDHERVTRLLDRLRGVVDERAVRYARVNAATLAEYRRLADAPDEPRILLLIDNFAGFRAAYELGRSSRLYEMLPGLALDGRSVGVHLVLSAGRPGDVPAGLAATAKRRLTLRLVQDIDLSTAGLAADAFGAGSPAGRGYLDGLELQLGVLGGDPDVAAQAGRTRALAERLAASGAVRAAPVGRLPERVELSALHPEVGGEPTLGVAEDTLTELGFTPDGSFLIAGPPQSGRTTALLTATRSLLRFRPDCRFAYVGAAHSPLTGSSGPAWQRTAVEIEDVEALAAELVSTWLPPAGTDGTRICLVVENLPRFADTPAQAPLERLVSVLVGAGHTVVADGETSALTSSWGLPGAMKAARHGLLLQPDQTDGDAVLRTALPRLRRADFPAGRGVHVRSGRVRTVQVALPA